MNLRGFRSNYLLLDSRNNSSSTRHGKDAFRVLCVEAVQARFVEFAAEWSFVYQRQSGVAETLPLKKTRARCIGGPISKASLDRSSDEAMTVVE